jgi:hypothetical protein
MRNPIASLAAGTAAITAALALAGCGSDGAANNSAANNLSATELNVGDPAAVEIIGNGTGTQGTDAGIQPAAPANSAGTPPADVPVDGPGSVGGDTGGNAGEAINGM